MISHSDPNEQKERLKANLAEQIKGIKAGFEQLKKLKIRQEDFNSLRDALIETDKLGRQVIEQDNLGNPVKGDDFLFLQEQLDEIGKLTGEIKKEDFNVQEELGGKDRVTESESRVSILRTEIGTLQDSVRRLALRSYLREELDSIKTQIEALKIDEEDRSSLDAELTEKTDRVVSFEEDTDTQLFILRREIGVLRENVEALTVKRNLWSRIPMAGWIAIITLPLFLYFAWLSLVQWRNPEQIYYYPGTQTAVAQTAVASQTVIPVATGTGTPGIP